MYALNIALYIFLKLRGYLAPEMLQRTDYHKSVDIWALGVIVFVLLCGCLPFDEDSSKINSQDEIQKKFTLRFPKWSMNLSASAKDLLQNLLDIDPQSRFTAEQALAHHWVAGRTVATDNYLESPGRIGLNRKVFASPMTTSHLQVVHNRINQVASGRAETDTGDVTGAVETVFKAKMQLNGKSSEQTGNRSRKNSF